MLKHLSSYNFTHNWPKVADLRFLESAPKCLKMCQESMWYHNPVGNKTRLKIYKKCLFHWRFFQNVKNLKYSIFMDFKIRP